MYSAENYHWGLVGYYLGCLLLILFVCRYRTLLPAGGIGRHIRNLLVLLIAVVILVPVKAYLDSDFLAPAWFVSLFEWITEPDKPDYLRGLQPIVVCYLASVVVYIIWAIFGGRKKISTEQETDSADSTDGKSTVDQSAT